MEAIIECMPSVTHQPMQSQTSSLSSTTPAFQHHPSGESPTYQTLSAVHCSRSSLFPNKMAGELSNHYPEVKEKKKP